MDIAEDRGRFSDLLKDLGIPYPKYGVAESAEEALVVAKEVGYPVLVRPSYVLGGQGMSIVINDEELENMGWNSRPLCFFLDNGTSCVLSMDDEGNDGGVLFYGKDGVIPVIR